MKTKTKAKISPLLLIVFTGLIIGGFLIHLLVLKYLEANLPSLVLMKAYGANSCLAVAIIIGLYKLRVKHRDSLAYLFFAGSLMKGIVYFLAFRPAYLKDEIVTKAEFATYLIPLLICLFIETFILIKLLQEEN